MMLELLKRLAELDPELIKITPSGDFDLGGVVFYLDDTDVFSADLGHRFYTKNELALDLLQGKLQRAIERRGWDYEQKYLGRQHEVVIFSRDPVQVTGMDSAAGALLAAYVKAMEAIR